MKLLKIWSIFITLLVFSSKIHAITYQVNTTKDVLDFTHCTPTKQDYCSLRSAIIWANVTAGHDVIEISAGNYSLTLQGNENLETGYDPKINDLDITDSVTLRGAGIDKTILHGDFKSRIIDLSSHKNISQTVIIEGMTLEFGYLPPLQEQSILNSGAAIRGFLDDLDVFNGEKEIEEDNNDTLIINEVKFRHNLVTDNEKNDVDFLAPYSASVIHFVGNHLWIQNSRIENNGLNYGFKGFQDQARNIISVPYSDDVVILDSQITKNGYSPIGPLLKDKSAIRISRSLFTYLDSLEITENKMHGYLITFWESIVKNGKYPETSEAYIINSTIGKNYSNIINNYNIFENSKIFLLNSTIYIDENASDLTNYQIALFGPKIYYQNSIIFTQEEFPPPCYKASSMGYNIVFPYNEINDSNTCNLTSTDFNIDPLLNPLDYYGSKNTRTYSLMETSPAIDSGIEMEFIDQDQRGFPRPWGNSPDRGAYEKELPLVPLPSF